MASSASGNPTSFWIKFFTESGIPAGEAANYAVIFSDHRIQVDMLLELNKEYLNDMGVTMMGDIIAILRHAKIVHAQNAREKALKGTTTAAASAATASPRRKTPASRMVDHYLNLSSDPDAGPMNSSALPVRAALSEEMQSRLGTTTGGTGRQSPSNIIKISTTGTRQKEEVPVPKFRRVLPEHEGRYQVIMPMGTTKKTRKILEDQGLVPKKNSVFDRLGQSNSPGPEPSTSTSSPKITVTGLGKITVQSSSSSDEGSSVFKRLGGKTAVKRPATSTSNIGDADTSDSDSDAGDTLPYAGVLKASSAKRRALEAKKKALITQRKMAADAAKKKKVVKMVPVTTQGILAQDVEQRIPLKQRLGPKITAASSTTTAVSAPKISRPTVKISPDVHSRLGPQLEVSSTDGEPKVKSKKEPGVFGRLGRQVSM